MPQSAAKVLDHSQLFHTPEYKKSLGTEPFSLAWRMKALRSSPITSAMQVVETAIIFGS